MSEIKDFEGLREAIRAMPTEAFNATELAVVQADKSDTGWRTLPAVEAIRAKIGSSPMLEAALNTAAAAVTRTGRIL